MRKLLIATRNVGKLQELRQFLCGLPFTLVDLNDFSSVETVKESGRSFAENATLKATGYARQTKLLTLADDSGLVVDALGGAPGIKSARYAGPAALDEDRVDKLLAELAKIERGQRTARFVCAIGLANEEAQLINLAVGECQGQIAFKPRGTNGFGYDPLFIPAGCDQTFAELSSDSKNRISHRACALTQTVEFLHSLTGSFSHR